MDGPLKIDPRYRKAAIRGIRFGLVFALVCVGLSVLSWAGVISNAADASLLLGMALCGAAVFIFGRLLIRFLRV